MITYFNDENSDLLNTIYAASYLEASSYHVEKSTTSSSTDLMSEEAETSAEQVIKMTFSQMNTKLTLWSPC